MEELEESRSSYVVCGGGSHLAGCLIVGSEENSRVKRFDVVMSLYWDGGNSVLDQASWQKDGGVQEILSLLEAGF